MVLEVVFLSFTYKGVNVLSLFSEIIWNRNILTKNLKTVNYEI